MKRLVAVLTLAGALALPVGSVFAASNPSGTGQPNQTCGSSTAPSTPGNSSSAPGSAFNPNGTSGGVYAGNGSGSAHSNSGNSVSQYDVACYQTSNNGP